MRLVVLSFTSMYVCILCLPSCGAHMYVLLDLVEQTPTDNPGGKPSCH